MQLYAHVQPNTNQQAGISIARPNGLISKIGLNAFLPLPCRAAHTAAARKAGQNSRGWSVTAFGRREGRAPQAVAGPPHSEVSGKSGSEAPFHWLEQRQSI